MQETQSFQSSSRPESGGGFWPSWRTNKLFTFLVALLVLGLIALAGVLAWSNFLRMSEIGKSPLERATISVSASGRAVGLPDVAVASLGLTVEAVTVAAAQKENSEKMNALLRDLRAMGIAPEDLQTASYSIYPKRRYDPNSGDSQIVGFTATQNVQAKIRDLEQVSAVLELAGRHGLNQVSDLSFKIDDSDELRGQARAEALEKAKKKASEIAESLGVRLGRVVAFSESFGGGPRPILSYADVGFERGGGGGAPEVESGSLDITAEVNIVFELQ